MKWSDIPFNPSRNVLRQFAALWLLCFLALGASQYFLKGHPVAGFALMAAALLVGLPGLIRPALVRRVFVAGMVLAFPVGWLISLLLLWLLYVLVLTPVAVFFRLRGRDLLGRKPRPGQASFWEPKQTPLDPGSYFRQY
ncbi:MAG: SxtJ family membrane protein [bacterium]